MINLAIDIGNSSTKIAFFEHAALIETNSFRNQETAGLKRLLDKYAPAKTILASVVDPDPRLLAELEQCTDVHHFPGTLRLPLTNKYHTPETLGADRLAAVIGSGVHIEPGDVKTGARETGDRETSDRLVIVAGTCITYNFVNSRNEFLGGAISPGLHMRFQAMHTFTGKLPLISMDQDFVDFLGRDTRESILSGVQEGALAETTHMIAAYVEQYPGLRVFLCGGDVEFFDKRLKNSIFADRIVPDRELILKGLDRVLNYQYK